MNDGNVNNNKTNNNYVWPVRGGEWNPALPHLFSFYNLYRNYIKCRRNKRGTINALRFEVNAEENLFREKLLSAEKPVVVVHETGIYYGRLKERVPVRKYLCAGTL